MNDFFNTLGIEATKEEKEIKKAYREKLHTVNPEDDPNGFKILREAYEEALKYARQKEDEKEKRLSPVEDFIFCCEQLYNDFYRRIDEQEWESLFSEDICISLESGEEVRQRFLVFLMEHFRLPAAVWKKIDRTFYITGNRKELLELFPEPYVDFLLQVVRYNGALNYELFEGEVSQDIDDYIEHYHKLRQYADLGMQKEAWQEYELMEEKYTIYHPYTKLEKARLLYSEKEEVKQEEGGTIFRQLAEKYPQEERIVCCYGRYCQEKNQVQLLKDSAMLDQLYELNKVYFRELTMYILAGKKKLEEEENEVIPALRKKAELSGRQEDAQEVNDREALCNRFDKKIHDLELTRMVSLQMAPQIRMVQSSDVEMSEKIQSTLVNTIPLWKSQMIIALGVEHSRAAAEAQRKVSDLTNDLLKKNAEKLKVATVETAKESERGIVDMETLVATNESLMSTIDEVMHIQQEGRQKRREAESKLMQLEDELKNKMLNPRG